jgi:sporulation protein YqfD
MNFFSSVITLSITGADISATLDTLSRNGIPLEDLRMVTELEAEMTVRRCHYRRLEMICHKRGDSLRFRKRTGLYWHLRGLLKRPVLMAGMLLYLLASLYLPSRVLFVRVVGNTSVPSRLILEAAAERGIRFGASRREVRSEKMKNALLEAVPQLQWAGVNTYGCIAEISVRERVRQEDGQNPSAFGHIVACRDGIITSCNAIRGTLVCAQGQAVSAGDILISGYTDCGLAIRAEQAQGEIYAATRHELQVIGPDFVLSKQASGQKMKKISLLVGKKRINFWKDSGIWDTTCDRMYEEYYITLPGGFRLPLALAVERFAARECSAREIPQADAETVLSGIGERYLAQIMVAGTVHSREISVTSAPGTWGLAGEYRCAEMIGFMQRLQIGE